MPNISSFLMVVFSHPGHGSAPLICKYLVGLSASFEPMFDQAFMARIEADVYEMGHLAK
jgi:hypothetical protein